MKVLVNKSYKKWKKTHKGNAFVLGAVESFLLRIFNTSDIKNITPQPKSVGTNLRKEPGGVYEFALSKRYRVYARCVELEPGVTSFCLAQIGSKGTKKQDEDILSSLAIFDDMSASEWDEWEPSSEQKKEYLAKQSEIVSGDVAAMPVPKQKNKKQKGKPVDENGLTVAERKALRKKEQEELRRKQQLAAEQKRRAEAEKQQQQKVASESQMADNIANKTDDTPETVAAPVVPVAVASDGTRDVADVTDGAAKKSDDAPNPSVTLNGVPVPAPQQVPDNVKFQDFVDVQYELEIIEHQIKIELLNIDIIQQNIAKAKREIALEELAMKKLKLLQAQKMQSIQK